MATRQTNKPSHAVLRAYQVGFGDCFLLTFVYPTLGERHMLLDFGSTSLPKGLPKDHMARVAQDIRERCGGTLHVVVATHRHKDHISGFARGKNGKGPGDIIKTCKPRLVIQPWTEEPGLAPDATAPAGEGSGRAAHRLAVKSLLSMQAVAADILREIRRSAYHLPVNVREEIEFLGDDNLSNEDAVRNLATMGPNDYVFYGKKLRRLESLLPGVTARVLGPPTLEQSDAIRTQRREDRDEFWQLRAAAGNRTGGAKAPFAAPSELPYWARWFAERVDAARGTQLLSIVRALDKAMNNTSVILLLSVGPTRLLFPGDAQIENWEYALKGPDRERNRQELADVQVYKVGHHGSLNATPKTLWEAFEHRSARPTNERLWSVMSTMAGKHGAAERDTEVPRETLVRALKRDSALFSTQDLRRDELSWEITIHFS